MVEAGTDEQWLRRKAGDELRRRASRPGASLGWALGLAVFAFAACGGKSSRDKDCSGVDCALAGRSAGGESASGAQAGTFASGGARTAGGRSGETGGGGSASSAGGESTGTAGGRISPALCDGPADQLRTRRLTSIDIDRSLDDILRAAGDKLGAGWPELRLGTRDGVNESQVRELVRVARARARDYARGHGLDCEADDAGCWKESFAELGLRIYRRPLLAEELRGFERLFQLHAETAGAEAGLAAVVEAMIESPHFVFRVELGNAGLLTGYELSTRLAYFFWRSAPDLVLLDAARAGELATPQQVRHHVSRLLDDPRSRFGLERMTVEWLDLSRFEFWAKSNEVPDAIIADMVEQTRRFLSDLYASDDPSLDRLLLATHSPLTAALADHYGVESNGLDATGFTDVELDPQRFSGILTHGTVLVTASTPSQRGLFVQETLLCSDFPAPPDDEVLPAGETRRERYEAISELAGCPSCHRYLDPLGFAFEGFDQAARFQSASVSGTLFETERPVQAEFDGPRGLGELLAANSQVRQCTVQRLLDYALDGFVAPVKLLQALPPLPEPPRPPLHPVNACLDVEFSSGSRNLIQLLGMIALSTPFVAVASEGQTLPTGANGRTPLEHARSETELLLDALSKNPATQELELYGSALVALTTEEPAAAEGGTSGADP